MRLLLSVNPAWTLHTTYWFRAIRIFNFNYLLGLALQEPTLSGLSPLNLRAASIVSSIHGRIRPSLPIAK